MAWRRECIPSIYETPVFISSAKGEEGEIKREARELEGEKERQRQDRKMRVTGWK